uniref:DUF2089 domain-containing protein n=1 Tax=Weissella hellenica TaxID=46256 RepID=H1A8I5_WEIHE|nr:hypothetical protein [Weissella hellenica]
MDNPHNWFTKLNEQESLLIRDLIASDFKINKLSKTADISYFVLKKKLNKIKEKVSLEETRSSEFKSYLDFLVSEDILLPSIASVIYTKYKENSKGENL